MRILIAPDKFKHAVSAPRAARAIADGLRDADRNVEFDLCPMADGGEGTGELLAAALNAAPRRATVRDPLARQRQAVWWWSAARGIAVIELAQAAGHALLTREQYAPFNTTTFGVGELIAEAKQAGASEIWVALGGSATIDGGAGLLQALGWRLFDATGRELPQAVGGGALARVTRVLPPAQPLPIRVTALVDVLNPLNGPLGAAQMFGPQKGASPAEALELDAALKNWVTVLMGAGLRRELDPNTPGFGAAGGVAVALRAAFDAEIRSGFDVFAAAVRLNDRLEACDVCCTGEGRLDPQTAGGKVVAGIARHARAEKRPVVAFVGSVQRSDAIGPDWLAQLGLQDCLEITPPGYDLPSALADTEINLRIAAGRWLSKRLQSNSTPNTPI